MACCCPPPADPALQRQWRQDEKDRWQAIMAHERREGLDMASKATIARLLARTVTLVALSAAGGG